MNIFDLVQESNKIEGILRDPTDAEIMEFERFLDLPVVKIDDLIQFVQVNQPNAELRIRAGLNVTVGNHMPPLGGQHILYSLQSILNDANSDKGSSWDVHIAYETLHPFTDGNGRSGRMLWHWMWYRRLGFTDPLGFLHRWYYQTLQNARSGV